MADDAAFRSLFESEYPRLVRELTLILGDRQQAEDSAADAFEQLLMRWNRISTYDRPGAWLRQVALRGAGRARWRRARRPQVEAAAPSRVPDDPRDLDLLDALRDLTRAQRTAVVLHHLGGWPAAEIAVAMHCQEATVRTHLHRGRQRLATLLGESLEAETQHAD